MLIAKSPSPSGSETMATKAARKLGVAGIDFTSADNATQSEDIQLM